MALISNVPRARAICRWVAWGCILAIALLSLTPAEHMTRTGLGGRIEHMVAYAGTTVISAVAYSGLGLVRLAFGLLGYAGGLEFLQRFVPGRVSSLSDFSFSATGVIVGSCVSYLIRKWPTLKL